MFSSKNIKWLFVVLAMFVLAGAAYAYAASNTVEASRAGIGSAAITGYDVTNIVYTLSANNTTIESVAFDLDAAATTVKACLVGSGTPFACTGTWYDCTAVAAPGGTSTCAISGAVTVLAANGLSVVATQ